MGGQCANLWGVMKRIKPYMAIVSLQFGYAGMYIISMVSMKRGLSHFVLAVYRHVVAFVVIAPFAFVLERKIRPKMTLPIFLRIMALGFLEPVIDQNLYYLGMKLTSATYGSAIVNVLPAVTFILAIIFRLEKVNLRKIRSQAKVIGTILTVAGATVMTLYKGPIIDIFFSAAKGHSEAAASSGDQNWFIGTLCLIGSACGWAGFFILQSFTLELYPAQLTLTTLICFTGMIQGTAITLVMDHDLSIWVIGWDSRLLAAVYSGVVCSGIAYYVQGVVNRERGPVFVTAFIPLCMIITALLGAIVLAEKVHLGSIIGATIIVMGLYSVVWGKSKDQVSTSLSNEKGVDLPISDNNAKSIDKTFNVVHLSDESINDIPLKIRP